MRHDRLSKAAVNGTHLGYLVVGKGIPCLVMHGGLGVTFEHDVHLYLRRQTMNRAVCGTPTEHRQRLADLAQQQEDLK